MNKFIIIILTLIFIFIILKFFINKIECKMIFQPKIISKEDANIILNNSKFKHSIENFTILTQDKEYIDSLYYKNPNNKNVILFAHGNAGNIYNRLYFIERFSKLASIILFDYRGYGLSTGIPHEKGVYRDILEVWDYYTNKLKIYPENIILYGESLGCSVVLWLGMKLSKSTNLPKGIIIQSGFYNLSELVKNQFTFLLTYFIKSEFDNYKYINIIKDKIPLLIIHSSNDEMINMNHANKLIDNCKINNSNLIIISGSHNSPKFDKNSLKRIEFFINKQI